MMFKSRELLDLKLQKELERLKNDDEIEIMIYLDTLVEESEMFSGSVGFSVNDKNEIVDQKVTINDSVLKDAVQNLPFEYQIAMIEEERAKQVKNARFKREEKSQEVVDKMLKKLNKKSFDKVMNFNKDAGFIKVVLRKSEILKLSKYSQNIIKISLPPKEIPTLESAFYEMKNEIISFNPSYKVHGGQEVGIYMREASNKCFKENNVTPVEDIIGFGGGEYTEDRGRILHADQVAQSLRIASPFSHIYCSDETYSLPSS